MKNQTGETKDNSYMFPSLELLDPQKVKGIIDEEQIKEAKERIIKVFRDFDIPVVNIEVAPGPSATLYEVTPHESIRISKIKSIKDDISLSIAATGIRIIVPVPGKNTIGIEVVNENREPVLLYELLKSEEFLNSNYDLPIALGATYHNKPYIADLSKMPHLIIGGANGLEKSILLNDIIVSLLYCRKPDELKFVLIDPSMVELSQYSVIENQYLAKSPEVKDPIVTDLNHIVATLESLCNEMDNRYQLLKEVKARNIKEYNEKIKESGIDSFSTPKMPYIVVVVQEWSDIILTAGTEVEFPIAKIAQKGRAVGIHIILGLSRPTTDVVTGIINANFPARISFRVSISSDSKVLMDETGAEQLGGYGDILISNNSPLLRAQAPLVGDDEISMICEHISGQFVNSYPYILPATSDVVTPIIEEIKDPLFKECVEFMVKTNIVSITALQRKFQIGYNRASKIMRQLEDAGIVSPPTRLLKVKKEDLNNLEL